MLLSRWESNSTTTACQAGIPTTRPRGRLPYFAYYYLLFCRHKRMVCEDTQFGNQLWFWPRIEPRIKGQVHMFNEAEHYSRLGEEKPEQTLEKLKDFICKDCSSPMLQRQLRLTAWWRSQRTRDTCYPWTCIQTQRLLRSDATVFLFSL